jgi:hypothetical protein
LVRVTLPAVIASPSGLLIVTAASTTTGAASSV